MNRRGFLKLLGMSLVTRPIGKLVEVLTTRKTANQVLSIMTGAEVLDAKMFIIPLVQLWNVIPTQEQTYMEGRLT